MQAESPCPGDASWKSEDCRDLYCNHRMILQIRGGIKEQLPEPMSQENVDNPPSLWLLFFKMGHMN